MVGVVLAAAAAAVLCAAAGSRPQPQPSPGAQPDLVCHPDDPHDCYPRVFQPTRDFRPLRPGQHVPAGLHVRLDMGTGAKQARLRDAAAPPDAALDGLPVDRAVVVVDDQPPRDAAIPHGAPRYDPVGKVKKPRDLAAPFLAAVGTLGAAAPPRGRALDEALDVLAELSHDMYYGLKLAEDPAVVKTLLCLVVGRESPASDGFGPRDRQAAAILAGVLQNNPPALAEVSKAWPQLLAHQCPDAAASPLRESLYASVVPSRNADADADADAPARVKAKVSAINGLVKDAVIRRDFLQRGGMRRLLEVLVPAGPEWAAAQRVVGQLVLDNFLDEDMGAELGLWPTAARLSDAECRQADEPAAPAEGCWDYHVARIVAASGRDEDHWSSDLDRRLAAARKGGAGGSQHKEL